MRTYPDRNGCTESKPIPGGFHYYQKSCRELIDCILTGRRILFDKEWGAHINVMLSGAEESALTGKKYMMQTRVNW